MSSASRLKVNNTSLPRAGKEQQKVPSKPSASSSTGSGILASAYNPLRGTFHSLEPFSTNSSLSNENGGFRNLNRTDEHPGSSSRTAVEYDSVSNNDSCSGESEDHKDKTTSGVHKEAIPGSDNDKRDKIRQKNERKHQRQRERRAQELHERCCGYLMSRKLEALAEQLVAMGFSSEQATMALMLNEGRVEESVAWLFEGGEEAAKNSDYNSGAGGNLKIDLAEELARIADMETRYKCSRQEVERVVVACEGDLEKTAETLRANKQERAAALPEQIGDHPMVNDGKIVESVIQNPMRPQLRATASVTIQQRDERNLDYHKAAPTVATFPESVHKNLQSLRITQPKLEWARPLGASPAAEKSWSNVGPSPSVSYSLASSLQVAPPPVKPEVRYVAVSSEVKNIQMGAREPVIMMQRPQSINANKNSSLTASVSVSSLGAAIMYPDSIAGTARMYPDSIGGTSITYPDSIAGTGRKYPDSIGGTARMYQDSIVGAARIYPDSIAGAARTYLDSIAAAEVMKSNGSLPSISSAMNVTPCNNSIRQQMYHHQPHCQSLVSSSSVDYSQAAAAAAGVRDGGSWSSITGTLSSPSSSHLVVPPPLGLFPGSGSPGPFGQAGPGFIPPSDYANIDWTVGKIIPCSPSRPSGHHSSFGSDDRVYDMWSSATSVGSKPMMRSTKPNGIYAVGGEGVKEGVPAEISPSSSSSSSSSASTVSSSEEWTSPFAGRDLFSIPRQVVTYPSL